MHRRAAVLSHGMGSYLGRPGWRRGTREDILRDLSRCPYSGIGLQGAGQSVHFSAHGRFFGQLCFPQTSLYN